jgi:hypothetical protein
MNSTAKTLIPEKEWLVKNGEEKIGSIAKSKKGYMFLKNGKALNVKDLNEINSRFGISIFEESLKRVKQESSEFNGYSIYDFPCSARPCDPIYNVKKKLPLFSKSSKSKSKYCAGYYVIKFKKGWVKSFCPKLITLERYPYQGPFKTESEMKTALNTVNKS